MKKLLALTAVLLISVSAYAQTAEMVIGNAVPVKREQLGTGTPAPKVTVGAEWAKIVDDGYYHTPQQMAGFPTAATIWPRVVEVQCALGEHGVVCDGYNWTPKLGRGEYLFIKPVYKEAPAPIIVKETTIIEKKILVEVPVKHGKE